MLLHLLLPLLIPLITALPAPPQSTTNSTPYIGLTAHFGTTTSPCASTPLDFNLKPPTTWLSSPPTSHCFPGTPGNIHNITCVTRRLTALPADNGLDTKLEDMSTCDMWGYTEQGCEGKYWVASRGTDGNGGNGSTGGQSWYWTEEEREAGPDLLDVRSWRVDCGV